MKSEIEFLKEIEEHIGRGEYKIAILLIGQRLTTLTRNRPFDASIHVAC